MSKQISPNSDYNIADENFYRLFENGIALTTDDIAYEIVGSISQEFMTKAFAEKPLRICDVGCYLGGSSARWHQHYQGRAEVVGVDIHASNIQIARSSYEQVEGLSFQHIKPGAVIPLIENQPYHAMFATFVLDTIHNFDDVIQLCQNMVSALIPDGEIYLLRLHPNALRYGGTFQEYQLNTKQDWSHGDPLLVKLIRADGDSIEIDDRFWHPSKIKDIFHSVSCDVEMMDVSFNSHPVVVKHLEMQVEKMNLGSTIPEWVVPLYQIIRVRKLDI